MDSILDRSDLEELLCFVWTSPWHISLFRHSICHQWHICLTLLLAFKPDMLSDSDTDILSDILSETFQTFYLTYISKIVSDILSGRGGAQRASDPVGPREMARWQCWLGSWQVREWVWCMLCCVVWFVCVQEVPLKSRDCHAANGENPASSSGWTPVVFPPKPNWWSGKHPDMISGNQTNIKPGNKKSIEIHGWWCVYIYYIYILWGSNMAMEHPALKKYCPDELPL